MSKTLARVIEKQPKLAPRVWPSHVLDDLFVHRLLDLPKQFDAFGITGWYDLDMTISELVYWFWKV